MQDENELAYKIAGEIAFSKNPGSVMRKWREIFGISQKELAEALNISPSTISDYEANRRKNPGIGVIRRYVSVLLEIDKKKGKKTLFQLLAIKPKKFDVLVKEFQNGVTASDFAKAIKAKIIANYKLLDERKIYGYTIIDSLKVIFTFNYDSFLKIFGSTPQRALIFTNEISGRSALVAVRLAPVKPTIIVLHRVKNVDKIAIKIAEVESIPLLTTTLSIDEIQKNLTW
ncbi:MAG: helix-turn-helix domain-containing protein [Candidatus Micrarchaeia archaeon]|jgi:putative transcriptional regulator